MPSQSELLAMLQAGTYGPWAGQGFVPNGITFLDPTTWQWVTIVGQPGSADVEMTVGDPVDPGQLEEAPVPGLPVGGIPPTITGTGGLGGHVQAAVVSATNYSIADFPHTALGVVRGSIGTSNGRDGPLSPVQMGRGLMEVDKDGNIWLPRVRFASPSEVETHDDPVRTGGGGGSW